MGKITRKIKAIVRLRKRKKKQLSLQKEEKAVLKLLQSMQVGDIEKVTLQGRTFLARRHPGGFEYSTNTELMDMIDRVGKAFDKVVPKFKSENDFEGWRKTLPKWGGGEAEVKTFQAPRRIAGQDVIDRFQEPILDAMREIDNLDNAEPPYIITPADHSVTLIEDRSPIVKHGDAVALEKVTSRPPDPMSLPPGVAEAIIDIPTYETWMRVVRPKLGEELGLKWGQDVNASITLLGGNQVKVQWRAYTPKGEAFLRGLGESLAQVQLPAPNLQLPGPTK